MPPGPNEGVPDGPPTGSPITSGAVARALIVSIVVGTILLLINQGDALLAGRWAHVPWWKAPLTYAVPFLVSLHSSLAATRAAQRHR